MRYMVCKPSTLSTARAFAACRLSARSARRRGQPASCPVADRRARDAVDEWRIAKIFMRRANNSTSGGRRGALGAVYAHFRLIARRCSMGTTGRFLYLGGFSRRDNAEGTRPRRVVEHVLQTGLALTSILLSPIEPSVQQMRSNSDSVPVGQCISRRHLSSVVVNDAQNFVSRSCRT